MKSYRVTIQADRYPMTWTVQASSWSVAGARGLRLWQKRFKHSKAELVKMTIVKGDAVAQSNTNE